LTRTSSVRLCVCKVSVGAPLRGSPST
jgi:hypothetical protein